MQKKIPEICCSHVAINAQKSYKCSYPKSTGRTSHLVRKLAYSRCMQAAFPLQ
jgi:hypothetical protein